MEEPMTVRDTRSSADQNFNVQSALVTPGPIPLPAGADARVLMTLIERVAMQRDVDLDRVQKLLDIKDRWERDQARKSFIAAMAAFKADPPTILKNKHVRFQTQKGVTEYDHATHDEVVNKIIPALAKYGFSHSWNVKQDKGAIEVTCILTHVEGHSESVTLISSADDSGGKNSIQALVSAKTYLERHTLIAVTGLTTGGIGAADDDGRAAADASVPLQPDGFAAWWLDVTAAADNGKAQLERAWGGDSYKTFRAYVTLYLPAEWARLKDVAAGAGQ